MPQLLTVKESCPRPDSFLFIYFYAMRIFAVIILLILAGSCSSNEQNEQPVEGAAKKPADTLPYYDFAEPIRNELFFIRASKKTTISKLTEADGKKDSVMIDSIQLMQLAAPFLQLNLNDPKIKAQYEESVFEDRDTKSFVFNYKTNSATLPVKSISIMLDNQYQDFKRLDMIKLSEQQDTLVEERLAWLPGRKFQVIRLSSANGKEQMKKTEVSWRERK